MCPCLSSWTVCICQFSPSSGSMSTQCHRGATLNTCFTHEDECWGRVKSQGIYYHILSFVIHFLFLSPNPKPLHSPFIFCLVQFFTHISTNISQPSELESKVPFAFLIRIASSRVSTNRPCELQLRCSRWTSKLCIVSCIVTFLHLVNAPVVWSVQWY